MFQRIGDVIHRIFREETLRERNTRMLPGAVYGFLAASAYTLTLSLINVLTYPGQHLAVDWIRLLSFWLGFGLALALAGVLAGWFTESYMGIIVGGIIMTLLLLLGNLLLSLINKSGASIAALSVITSLPLVGAGVLLAGALRLVINRHIHIRNEEPINKQGRLIAGLAAIVFVVGWFPGTLSRFDKTTADDIRMINENLSQASTDPIAASRLPMQKIPALKYHLGSDYVLLPRASSLSAGALELTIRFRDGYSVTCMIETPSAVQVYLTDCNEGETFISP